MDVAEPTLTDANANRGLKSRYQFSKTSRIVGRAGPLFSDVFFIERLLLSFVDLKILLNRNSNEFCRMASEADADYRVKLIDADTKLHKVKVNPSVSLAHEVAL